MNKPIRLCTIAASICLICTAGAQLVTTPNGAASDATNKKIHQLDLLIKLNPLVLKKSQFDLVLQGIDKARELERAEQEREDKILADLDPTVTTTVDNAVEKGIYPPRDIQNQIATALDGMSRKQIIVEANMVKVVYDTIETSLNAGQRKTMIGSFAKSYVSPSNPELATDEVILRFYVKQVFLDADAYALLKDLEKHATD